MISIVRLVLSQSKVRTYLALSLGWPRGHGVSDYFCRTSTSRFQAVILQILRLVS